MLANGAGVFATIRGEIAPGERPQTIPIRTLPEDFALGRGTVVLAFTGDGGDFANSTRVAVAHRRSPSSRMSSR